ncbi:response regulator [Litoreibacter sp.]|nr:response regulator [Litoreibacter sp.]
MTLQTTMPMENAGPMGKPVNALVLDDSVFDRKRIRRMNDSFDVPMLLAEAPTIEEMCARMEDQSFDLFIIDYGLPEGDGLAALDLVQTHSANKNAATIMITGNEQTDIAVAALKRGCSDFIAKPNLTPDIFRNSVVEVLDQANMAKLNHNPLRGGSQAEILMQVMSEALQSASFRGTLVDLMSDAMRQADIGPNRLVEMGDVSNIQGLIEGSPELDEFIFTAAGGKFHN